MPLEFTAYWAAKNGNRRSEYEDAFRPRELTSQASPWRFAVADGATETSFAKLWARLLARGFVNGEFSGSDSSIGTELLQFGHLWQRAVGRKRLPWYAEQKLKMGAYSSIIGLTLRLSDGHFPGRWDAMAVGDSCVFQTHGQELLRSFPLTQSVEFTSRPTLIGSIRLAEDQTPSVVRAEGDFDVGDRFFLMTDALACWFLRLIEFDESPLTALLAVTDQASFETLLNAERSRLLDDGMQALRNDDTTLMCITVLGD
jgi:hypothetical protein